jgi:UDP-N-acetylmuramate--alanine ligase
MPNASSDLASPSPSATGALSQLAGEFGCTAYLAGAGGCGMRGLATLLLQAGWQVFGADQNNFQADDPLVAAGMQALAETDQPPEVSLCIRSAAISKKEVAIQKAIQQGARSLLYSEMLGEISKLRPVLAVAGSHGKTTITAWLAWALRRAGVPVGYLVGAEVPQLKGSADWGNPDLPLIVESCEYARSFHHLWPAMVALINVDAEHPDTYPGGLAEVTQAFRHFLSHVRDSGKVFAGPEAPDLSSSGPGHWLRSMELGPQEYVGLPGVHNRSNAALVAKVLRHFGLGELAVQSSLGEFEGAARRLERIGLWHGATVVTDYAHHPVEVQATLQAAKERWPDRKLHVVFQPHQAQRFHAYRDQFAPALDLADALYLLEIYRARDPQQLQASVEELVPDLVQRRPKRYLKLVADFAIGQSLLQENVEPEDVILFLGAGNVDRFARCLC